LRGWNATKPALRVSVGKNTQKAAVWREYHPGKFMTI
jgi:hypothetical protein